MARSNIQIDYIMELLEVYELPTFKLMTSFSSRKMAWPWVVPCTVIEASSF